MLQNQLKPQHDKTRKNRDRHQGSADHRHTSAQHIGKEYDSRDDPQLDDQVPYTIGRIKDLLYFGTC